MLLSELKGAFPNISIISDGNFELTAYNHLNHAYNVLTFIENEKYLQSMSEKVSCVILPNDLKYKLSKDVGIIVADSPRLLFYLIHNFLSTQTCLFSNKTFETIIGKSSVVSENAIVSKNNVIIGENVVVEEGAIIKAGVIIGDNCIIRSGCIVGGEGFQYQSGNGTKFHVKHQGTVILENNVSIHHNTCIDRALWYKDVTLIKENTSLDSLIYIAHGCKIGKGCTFCSGVSIGGNTYIGHNTFIGMNATIRNSIQISDNSKIGMGSVVTKNIEVEGLVFGNPAIAKK